MADTLSAEAVLRKKGFLAETVVGTSMYPLLRENRDTVIVERITKPPRKYDVVLFRRDKQLVLHRIVCIKDDYFLIRGDNCIESEMVYNNQILGKMTHFYRKGKQHSIKNKTYRLYSMLWVKLFWVRLVLNKTIYALKKF